MPQTLSGGRFEFAPVDPVWPGTASNQVTIENGLAARREGLAFEDDLADAEAAAQQMRERPASDGLATYEQRQVIRPTQGASGGTYIQAMNPAG